MSQLVHRYQVLSQHKYYLISLMHQCTTVSPCCAAKHTTIAILDFDQRKLIEAEMVSV